MSMAKILYGRISGIKHCLSSFANVKGMDWGVLCYISLRLKSPARYLPPLPRLTGQHAGEYDRLLGVWAVADKSQQVGLDSSDGKYC
jgi:hypothetical protein